MADLTTASTDYASELRAAIRDYKTLAALKASTESLTQGDIVTAAGYRYQVAASGASDHDVARDDGAKLYVLPAYDGVWDEQWFDTADDATRVQKAINWTIAEQIANGVVYRVRVKGAYTMNQPLKLFDYNGTNSFNFISVHLEGTAQGYVAGETTTFTFTDVDEAGLVICNGRQITVKNIAIYGGANNRSLPSVNDILTRNSWWNTATAAESTYKVHAGINIDPFESALSAGERYAFFDGSGSEPNHYTISANNGTTQVTISHCDIQGWIYGVMCSGSGIQIGDSITIEKCNISYNKVAVVAGESQNRGITVNDCHAKGFDVFYAGGSQYVEGTGSGNYVNGGVLVYGYALVNASTDRGNGAFRNVYAEQICTFGYVDGGHGFSFQDCQIKFIHDENRAASVHLFGNGEVRFIGGYYGFYDNVERPFFFDSNVSIIGATMDGPPVPTNVNNGSDIKCENLSIRYGNFRGVDSGRFNGSFAANMASSRYALPGAILYDNARPYRVVGAMNVLSLGSATVSISAGVVSLTGVTNSDQIYVGDTLAVASSRSVSDNRASTASRLWTNCGYVTAVDTGTNTITLSDASIDLGDTESITIGIVKWPTVRPPIRGTTTSASTSVSGTFETDDFYVGSFIKGNGIPSGTRVEAITTSSITLSKAATASGTTDLYDAQLWPVDLYDSAPPSSGTFPTGSFCRNIAPSIDGNNMILRGWTCTTGGSPGTWSAVYGSSVTPAT